MGQLFNNLRVCRNSGGSFYHEDMFQYMPERRIRVNPEGIPDLACWLIACSAEWEAMLRRTHAGLNATQRKALRGQKAYARHALAVVGTIIRRMAESVKAGDFEAACDMWRKGCEEALAPPTDATAKRTARAVAQVGA